MNVHRFTLLAALLTSPAFAQTNTFPASGSVGIGTTIPASKLDVQGTPQSPGYEIGVGRIGAGGTNLLFGVDATATPYTWIQSVTNGVAGRNLILQPIGNNVGIGTASPTEKLEVNGNIKLGDSRATSALTIGNFGHKIGREPQDGSLYIGGGQASIILQNNVGIGTTAPDAPLAVNGRIRSNSWQPYGSDSNDFYVDVEPNTRILRTRNWNESSPNVAATGIHTGTGWFEGNVGIGTTNPQHKLAVNGTIKAKEVIVETTGWSDYVFADDYRLAPLSEVEAHIKTNKHLPGIPSAAQVAENGVNLGDVQSALLAKVEELTLHLIAQQKQLNIQQQNMAALQKENQQLQQRLQAIEQR